MDMILYLKRRKIVKKLISFLIILGGLFLSVGCDNKIINLKQTDNQIYTTVYPIEFLATTLNDENTQVSAVFPDGSNPTEYKLTNKQITDYSLGNIFIYNGLTDEKDLARKLINKNNNLKIIDVSYGLTLENGPEELWLSPSNFLMLSATVKENLMEILDSKYSKETIEKNYEELRTEISQMDAELRVIAASVDNPTLVVDSKIFKFLEKYGYKVICLEDEENLTPNSLSSIQKEFQSGNYKYILIRDDIKQNEIIDNLVNNYKANTMKMKVMATIKEEDRKANDNYYTLMQENIDNIRNVIIGN